MIKWIVIGLCLYFCIVFAVYFYQDKLLFFPDRMAFSVCPQITASQLEYEVVQEKNLRYYKIKTSNAVPKGWVIHYHGNGGRACDRFPLMQEWLSRGYNLVLAEYPGYSENTPVPGMKQLLKVSLGIFQKLKAEIADNVPVILYGESLGSAVATFVASQAGDEISALILQSPFTSVAEVGQDHYFLLPVKWLVKHSVPADEWARQVNVPVFIFHGSDDFIVPVKFGKKQARNFPIENRVFWEVPEAAHNDLVFKAGTRIWDYFEAFLNVKVNSRKLNQPLIIAHRGASGYRPEHTLAAYELAIEMGADVIEPDLVITRDGVLIARHENELSRTTDVATRFPNRKTTKIINGKPTLGWFAEDFTLAEIKQLRVRQPFKGRDPSFDGKFEIPTFEEVLDLAQKKTQELQRKISIYPETKTPLYFQELGLPLEPPLVEILKRKGWDQADSPVFIQSFELSNLRALSEEIPTRLVYLLGEKTPSLDELKSYSSFLYGIGPWKRLILPEEDGRLTSPTPLLVNAHSVDLVVHPYTFRSDASHLHSSYEGDPLREYEQFYRLGVDGVFTDFPDHALEARKKMFH